MLDRAKLGMVLPVFAKKRTLADPRKFQARLHLGEEGRSFLC